MAKVARQIRVASNPRSTAAATRSRKGKPTMTAAKKKAFVARMAKARKASARNPATRSNSRKNKQRNPATKANRSARHSNKRRNPETLTALIGDPKTLLIQAVAGLVAAVATRQLPQMLMGASNVGWKGYLANAGTGLATTWLAAEFVGRPAGQAALIGSSVIILDRVLTEKVSPIGQYLQLTGVGDATAATSLGTIADGYYIHPTIVDANGRPIIPHEITDAALAATLNKYPQLASAAPAPAGTMAGAGRQQQPRTRISSRFAPRFN